MPNTPQVHRVLVADDAPEVCLLVSRLLGKAGYQVETAEDGAECLEKVASFRPHMLVVDIMMPKVHGIDVLRQLGERGLAANIDGKPIGVIVCSARAFDADRERAMQLGAIGFLVKPIHKQRLLELIEAHLGGKPGVEGPSTAGGPAPHAADTPALPATQDVYLPELDSSRGVLRLWGTRGSIPAPGAAHMRHGGNTASLEVRHGEDVVIIDAGTGIREAGMALAKGGPRRVHLFIGHTHWDHIQGFPFFAPAYISGFELYIYGASGFGKDLESVFHGQLDRDYFPVDMREMKSTMHFHKLDGPVRIGGASGSARSPIEVYWDFAFHPGATIGFRIHVAGKRIGYLTDNEFLRGYVGAPAPATQRPDLLTDYDAQVRFFSGLDLLVSDAQYTNEEYLKKIGWGHTSVSNACVLAALTRPKRWLLTHHDPAHDDATLDRKLALVRQELAKLGHDIEVANAYDGMAVYL